MRRTLLLSLLLLTACRKREDASPAPETKPSAAPEPMNSVEAMSCRDGVFGRAVASTAPSTTASAAAASAAPSSSVPAGIASLVGSDPSLFAPIGGLGLSGTGGLGSIGGLGHGAGFGRLEFPIVGAPTSAGGAGALAIAKGVCAAHPAIKLCREAAQNPSGSLTFEIKVDENGASAAKTAGDLEDATLVTCLSGAIAAQKFERAGAATYAFTFEPGRRVKGPTFAESGATAAGSLPPEVVRRIVRTHAGKIRRCYQKLLDKDPKATGNLRVKFTIDGTGKVAKAAIADGTITDATMRSCVESTFSAMTFPAPKDGSNVEVSYPLTFSSGE